MKTSLFLIAVAGACIALATWAWWPIRCPACGESFDTVDDREHHFRMAHRA